MTKYNTSFTFSELPDSVEIGHDAGRFTSSIKGDEFVSHYENLSEADKNRLTQISIQASYLTSWGRWLRSAVVSVWNNEGGTFKTAYNSDRELLRHTKQFNEINKD